MSFPIKEGILKKWSPGKNTWKEMYCKLLNNRFFQWFDSAPSQSPKRSIDVAIVSAFLAFGEVLNRVPGKPSSIGPAEVHRCLGIPHEPNMGTKIAFFMANSDAEAQSWIQAIHSVIQVNVPFSHGSSAPGYSSINTSYPSGPTNNPGYPSGPSNNPGYPSGPPHNPGYPNGPSNNPGYPSGPPNNFGYPAGPPSYYSSVFGFADQQQPNIASSTPYPASGAGFPSMPAMPEINNPYPVAPTYPSVQHTSVASSVANAHHQALYPVQPGPSVNIVNPPTYYHSGMRPQEGQVLLNPGGQAYKVVVVDGKKRKKKLKNKALAGAALGGVTGLAAGMMIPRMFGGGWGGGYHCGPHYGGFGSWSSFSSFSSFSWSS